MENEPNNLEQESQEPSSEELTAAIKEWCREFPNAIREDIESVLVDSAGEPFDVVLGNILTYLENSEPTLDIGKFMEFLAEKGLWNN